MTTRTPVMRPLRSSRTRSSPPFSSAHGRSADCSRRSKPSSRTTLNGEQPYPWDLLQPQDVIADIEVPNTAVDMNSWAVSACYPGVPLSVERWPFHSEPRITMTCFRTCSRRHARSQAGLCHCTNLLMSEQDANLVLLRYSLGGAASQTTHQTLPQPGSRVHVRTSNIKGWYFRGRLHADWRPHFKASTYPTHQGSMFSVKL